MPEPTVPLRSTMLSVFTVDFDEVKLEEEELETEDTLEDEDMEDTSSCLISI